MTKRSLAIGLLLLVFLFPASPHETFAATYYFNVSYTGPGGCSSSGFGATVSFTWSVPVGGNSLRYDNGSYATTVFTGTGSTTTVISNTNPPGSVPYTYTIDYYVVDSTNTALYQTRIVVTCGVGNVLGVQISNNYIAPVVAPAPAFAGPAIPSSFVLRTITCDVAVFNVPGGIPLPSGEKIKAGQTWFVNPESVKATNNELYPEWTEIFTSSAVNGYIPTACVGQ